MASTGVAGGYQRRRFAGVTFATGPTPPVANPAAWFAADQITGVNDATKIASWPDLSGGGHNLAQATGADQPTFYKTTSAKLVNGKPAVWFDGAATFMSAALTVPQPFTVCMAAQVSGVTQMYMSNGAAADPYMWCQGGPALSAAAGGAPQTLGAVSVGIVNSVMVCFNAASTYGVMNAVTTNAAASIGTDGLTTVLIGSYQGTGDFLNGPICEALIYPKALSAGEVTTVYNYFKTRWATP